MNVERNAVSDRELDNRGAVIAAPQQPWPFLWSVRRELWENRSIYIAPVVVAVLAFFAFVMSTYGMPARRRGTLLLDAAHRRAKIAEPFDAVAVALFVTSILIGVFYCLDALHSERRDRSILFWKSMPVSDTTTVLSKVAVPMALLPAITFAVTIVTQVAMLLWSTLVLMPSGQAWSSWKYHSVIGDSPVLLFGLAAAALWHAPIYAWFLLVSGWARRAVVLWAVIPIFALGLLETIAFRTKVWAFAMRYRLIGVFDEAFSYSGLDAHPRVANYIATPGLWIGLAFAAVFLFLAARLRRDREPI